MKPAVPQYAFYFDASACSGCKACQIACKDKHRLEQARSWRQVYEVEGGDWEQVGNAWVPDVFAYHLSVACNHCEKPICAEVCPTHAISKRIDGIVLIDVKKCLGCGYCSWACPYSALDYDKDSGHMTKCTFCVERIDEGRSPECVAACPMRVLDFGDRETLTMKYGSTNGSYPLPEPDLTEPHFLVTPHKDARRKQKGTFDVIPRAHLDMNEWPLILFTLLSQLTAGALIVLVILNSIFAWKLGITEPNFMNVNALFGVTLVFILSLLISFFHLGKPQKSHLAIINIGSSWLSREAFFGATLAGLLVFLSIMQIFDIGSSSTRNLFAWAAVVIGIIFVSSMSRVYMLRTVPTWNSLKTPLSFFITALMLGDLAVIVYLSSAPGSIANTLGISSPDLMANAFQWFALSLFGLLVLDMLVTLIWWADFDPQKYGLQQIAFSQDRYRIISGLRLTLTFLGISLIGAFLYQYSLSTNPVIQLRVIAWLSFGLVLIAKIMGRYLFYKSYLRFGL
ncbi:MAG: dimethylsulfoxide reductase subunit B [Anaerolineales bacterium]|nr:dimethylsulfoxide reductase subunit B [Anaerolineales bacterium]